MKVLSFGVLFFKLPDDFDGGLSDALRAFADYHDSVTDTPKQRIGGEHATSSEKTEAEHAEEVWDDFWSTIHESGSRVYGVAGVTDYPDGGEGVHLDLNTGKPDTKARWATMADVEGLGVIELSHRDWEAQAIRGESIPPFVRKGTISSDRLGRCLAVYFRDVEHLQEVLGIAHPVYLCVPDKPCTYPVKPGAIVALICRRLGKLED